jgi:hypothetical protein
LSRIRPCINRNVANEVEQRRKMSRENERREKAREEAGLEMKQKADLEWQITKRNG